MSYDLTERITFRLSWAERRALENAARAYNMETGRLVRKLITKALADLKPPVQPVVVEELRFS